MRRSGIRAYIAREVAELGIIVAVLAVVDQRVAMPTIVWAIVPPVKIALSLIAYRFIYRGVLRRTPRIGPEALIGRHGRVTHPLDPDGQVVIRGERWRARVRDASTIAKDRSVEVVAVRGTMLEVRPLNREGDPVGEGDAP
jgi:membrane-bound ClpP family serine protease